MGFYAASLEGGAGAALLFAGAVGAAAWSLFWLRDRPRPLLFLRLLTVALLAICVSRLSLHRLHARQARPKLAVLLDGGPGMGAKDAGDSSRLKRAIRWLKDHRSEIEARAEPLLYVGTDRSRRARWEDLETLVPASAVGLDLARALRDVGEDGSGASRLWLLSDGGSGSGGLAAALGDLKIPVDALGVGPSRSARSLALAELKIPDFVFLHSRFPVQGQVEASGLPGARVEAKLWKGGNLVERRPLDIQEDFEVKTVSFTATAESLGTERYRLELDVPNSRKLRREFGVEVIRQKHRIMYLAGRPSPEYAHLREQLKSDPNHELVSFVILRNPENVSPVPDQELSLIPFPAQEIFVSSLAQFDLFILENFAYWRFSLPVAYLENLKRFVSQGGALLILGGSNAYTKGGYRSTPLEEVLPVQLWGSADDYTPGLFHPELSAPDHPLLRLEDGERPSSVLWSALPPLDGHNRFSAVRPGASVLLSHPSEKMPGGAAMPIVALREYGKGKVMVLGTDSTWRWKLGGGRDLRLSSFYGRFWSRAVQYLSGTLDLKKVKFAPLPEQMPPQEPALLTLRLFDSSFKPLAGERTQLRVVWTPPGGPSKAVGAVEREIGVFDVELTGLGEGVHTVRAMARHRGQAWGEDQARFSWEPGTADFPFRRQWLSQLAERAGGRYADISRMGARPWLEALPPVRTDREVAGRWHLWAWPGWMWAMMALLLLEWFLRRLAGYV